MIGFPVALKISSVNAIHKTEIGGVAAVLNCEAEVLDGFGRVMTSFESKNPDTKPDGVVVQKQGVGFELIVA